jgi:hypothetical protein
MLYGETGIRAAAMSSEAESYSSTLNKRHECDGQSGQHLLAAETENNNGHRLK